MSYIDEEKLANNLRHIAAFEAKPYPKPQPATAVTRGFGNFGPPKLVKQLKDGDPLIRQKSLKAALELLRVPQVYVQCLNNGIVPALTDLLHDENALIRQRAAACLELVAVKLVGCEKMLRHRAVTPVLTLLADADGSVRDAAYHCLARAAKFDCIALLLVNAQFLPTLLGHTLRESDPRAILGLQALRACTGGRGSIAALDQLLGAGSAVSAMAPLLERHRPLEAREAATQLLGRMCTRADARWQIVETGYVSKLLQQLQSGSQALALAGSAALAALTVAPEAKQAVFESRGCAALESLLREAGLGTDGELLRNVLEIVCNVAEQQAARQALGGCAEAISAVHRGTTAPAIQHAAGQALRLLSFQARPFQLLPSTKAHSATQDSESQYSETQDSEHQADSGAKGRALAQAEAGEEEAGSRGELIPSFRGGDSELPAAETAAAESAGLQVEPAKDGGAQTGGVSDELLLRDSSEKEVVMGRAATSPAALPDEEPHDADGAIVPAVPESIPSIAPEPRDAVAGIAESPAAYSLPGEKQTTSAADPASDALGLKAAGPEDAGSSPGDSVRDEAGNADGNHQQPLEGLGGAAGATTYLQHVANTGAAAETEGPSATATTRASSLPLPEASAEASRALSAGGSHVAASLEPAAEVHGSSSPSTVMQGDSLIPLQSGADPSAEQPDSAAAAAIDSASTAKPAHDSAAAAAPAEADSPSAAAEDTSALAAVVTHMTEDDSAAWPSSAAASAPAAAPEEVPAPSPATEARESIEDTLQSVADASGSGESLPPADSAPETALPAHESRAAAADLTGDHASSFAADQLLDAPAMGPPGGSAILSSADVAAEHPADDE